jgi:hypothetical protein
MFLNRGLREAGNVSDLVQAFVGLVAALRLGPATIAQALDVERVSELQQPVLALRKLPKIRGWRALKPLSSFERC